MFTETCGRIWKRYMPEIKFSKKELQIWDFIWIIYIYFVLLESALGRLGQIIFNFFVIRQPWWPTFLLSSILDVAAALDQPLVSIHLVTQSYIIP